MTKGGRCAWFCAIVSLGASADALAVCTFGTPFGGEPTLQASLDALLSPAPNVETDCLADGVGPGGDAQWRSIAPTSATILLEIAGFRNSNVFGLYDPLNPDNRLDVFVGPDGPGTVAQLVFTYVGGSMNILVDVDGDQRSTSSPFLSSTFGFYITTPQNNTFFSDSSLNGGLDRMYAYLGNGATFISGPIASDGDPTNDIFGAGDAILAYEDLVNGDQDYQDFVVLVRGVTPVPLPPAGWLLASALVALFGLSRRRTPTGRSLVAA
jgi:hypothetical protein